MTRTGLTPEQSRLLEYIASFSDREEHCPSYEQMKKAMGLASKSGIHRLIQALHERGAIRRLPNRARSIEVVNLERFAPEVERKLASYCRQNRVSQEAAIALAVERFFGGAA